MKIITSHVVVSDADVIIKFYLAGHFKLLGDLFDEVIIPGKVHNEICKVIGKQTGSIDGLKCEWLKIINISDRKVLTDEQINLITITMKSFEFALDDGEREAFSLVNELAIPFLLIDDASAKRIIENNSSVITLSHIEILFIATLKDVLTFPEAEQVFKNINAIVSRPIRTPFRELIKRVKKRLQELGLL